MCLQPSVVCLAVLVASPALAQIGNPGFMAPETRMEAPGVQAPNQINATDRLFAQLATEGGLAEVAFGKMAANRARADAVGEFARRMVEEHDAANEKLAGIADKSKIPLPDALNPEHQAMRERLEELEGEAFDLAYMRGQVVDHQKTTQLLLWQINWGQDPELKAFAAETLPKVLDHLAAARGIVGELANAQVARAESPPAKERAAPRPQQ